MRQVRSRAFMGRLQLMSPTNVLPLRAARDGIGDVHGRGEANGYQPGAIESGLPLTPQRLDLIKAYANGSARRAQAPTASQIARRFAPRAEAAPPRSDPEPSHQAPITAPFSLLASGIRRLTAVLVVAALLPNLTLAAFWLRLIELPWSQSATSPSSERPVPAAQFEIALPVLSAPALVEATAGENIVLPIALDGTDGVPAGSLILIKGLPRGSTLSGGRPHGETDWSLRPDEIGDLHLVAGGIGSGESRLTIQLLAPNNGVLADAATVLKVTADPAGAYAAAAIDMDPAEARLAHALPKEIEIAASVEPLADRDETGSIAEPVPLPTRRPQPNAQDEDEASWIRPSAYVNLREAASPNAPVVNVVAKGAKLRVIGRKRGWVQVTDPATSQSGWIYSGNVETLP
jgi:hypothetical protein